MSNLYIAYLKGYAVRLGLAVSVPDYSTMEEMLAYCLGGQRGLFEKAPEAKAEVERQVHALLNNDVAVPVSGAV